MGSLGLRTFHLIKVRNTYLGCNHIHKKPVVFTFLNQEHANNVKDTVRQYKYKVEQVDVNVYKMNAVERLKRDISQVEIEQAGLFDTQIHLTINGVDMFIVDHLVKDAKNNLHLVNDESNVEPLFINTDMQRMHLNKFVS